LPAAGGALDLAVNARFWYARLQAVQAIAFRERPTSRTVADSEWKRLLNDPHPLVQVAARLGKKCAAGADPGTMIWESEDVSKVRGLWGMDPLAVQLFGEHLLLLNLSEQGPQEVRDENARRSALPECFTSRNARPRLTEQAACPDSCEFQLCPYQFSGGFRHSRNLNGQDFARAMRRVSSQNGPPPWYHGYRSEVFSTVWRHIERASR